MPLQDDFQSAARRSKQLTKRPSNEDLLNMYALFKQATDGEVSGDRPGGFDFKAIAKYDAWASKKAMSQDQAMQEYTVLVDRLEKEN